MKHTDSIVTILHNENNKLEEIEILKKDASRNLLNDVINCRNFTKYYSQLTARYQQDDKPKESQRYFNSTPASLKMC